MGGRGYTANAAFSRSLVILPFVCFIAKAVRNSDDEVEANEATAKAELIRYIVTGYDQDCTTAQDKGWHEKEALPMERMADPSVFYFRAPAQTYEPCKLGFKILHARSWDVNHWGAMDGHLK